MVGDGDGDGDGDSTLDSGFYRYHEEQVGILSCFLNSPVWFFLV